MRHRRTIGIWLALVCAIALPAPASAANCSIGRVQLILPGMTPTSNNPGYSGSPHNQVLGIPFNATVNVLDQSWDPCPGNSVSQSVQLSSSTDPNVSFPNGATLSFLQSAVYSIVFGTAGSMTITAADLTDPNISPTSCPAVTVQVLDHFTTNTIGTGNPLQVTAGSAFSINVTAKDPGGATVLGYNGTSAFSETTSNGNGTASPASGVFSQAVWSGQGILYRADLDTTGGVGHAHFHIIASEVAASGDSNGVVVVPAAFSRLQILVPGETPNPGVMVSGVFPGKTGWPATQTSGAAFQIRVNAVDAYRNAITGIADAVYFSSTDTAASLPANAPSNAVPLINGAGVFTVTLNTVGAQTITVYDASNNQIIQDVSSTVNVLSPGSTATVTPPPTPTVPPGSTATPPPPTPTVPAGATSAPTATLAPAATATAVDAASLRSAGSFWSFPNPFAAGRENTTLVWILPAEGDTRIWIYDVLGNRVASWHFASGSSGGRTGVNRLIWSGADARGKTIAAGSYVAVLDSASGGRSTTALRKIGARP